MNKDNLTRNSTESERKAVGALINILLIFIFGLVAFSAGYYLAMREASALIKTILN